MQRRMTGYFLSALFLMAALTSGVAQELPREYTSVCIDRDLCLAGDRANFSAWCRQSHPTERPLSSTMYVELLNGRGEAILSQKYPIREGRCHGTMEIPPTTATGVYFLRAYTQYQRNDPPESHATAVLTIVNADENIQPLPVPDHAALEARAEYGSPMPTQASRWVIKAPVEMSSPDSIALYRQGSPSTAQILQIVGPYCLMALAADQEAPDEVVVHDAGQAWQQELPVDSSQAVALALHRPSASSLQVTLAPAPSLQSSPTLTLVLTDRHFHPLSKQVHRLAEGDLEVLLSSLAPTAQYLFVLSAEGAVLAGTKLPDWELPQPKMTVSTERLAPRQSATLTLSPSDLPGMSVSVSKAIPFPAAFFLDLIWANPWLVGQVSIPDSLQDIAQVLQGQFLRQHGRQLLERSEPRFLPESRGLELSGRVVDRKTKEGAADVLTVLSVIGEHPQIHPCRTDSAGHFRVALRNLQGMETLFIGVQEGDQQDLEIAVNQDFSPNIPDIQPVALRYDSALHHTLESLYVSKQVRDRYRELPTEERLAAQPIPALPLNMGTPDMSINVEEYVLLPTMEEVIHNIVPDVSVQRLQGKPNISVYEARALAMHRTPLILLDYAVVFDIEAFLKVSPRKLRRFDVYEGSYYLGEERFDGIVSVTTNTNNFAGYPFSQYGAFVRYATFQPPLGVRAINHESLAWPSHLPDFRSVLYWHPDAALSSHIQAGDQPGPYHVRLSGMTLDGRIFRESLPLEVVGTKR
jgi:hypothetical protein